MKILLIGFYGKGNAGDERLYHKSIHLIKSCVDSCEISTKKTDFFRSDRIVFGAGGLFQNVSSMRSLLYYSFWAYLSLLFKKKYILLGQGIGPVKGWFSNKILDGVISNASKISVRDTMSYSRTIALRKDVTLGSDLAFYSSHFNTMFNPHGSVLINLRPWTMSPSTRKDIDAIVKKFGAAFVPFSEDDVPCNPGLPLREITSNFIYDNTQEISCSALICMRFHACVWAVLHGIPFFALVYDDKVLALAKQMKQSWVDIRDYRADAPLLTQCSDFFDNLETYSSHVIQQRMSLISEADNHKDVFHG